MVNTTKPFAALRYKYADTNGKLADYLEMVNRKKGIIKDDVTKSCLIHQGFIFDDDVMAQSKYEPEELFTALMAYDQKQTFRPDNSLFHRALTKVFKHFVKLRGSLVPFHPDEVLRTLKWTASAGAPHFTSKKEAIVGWKYDKDKVGKDPCVAYYRTQARQNEKGEWRQKVRLVWGYPLDTTISEGKYARPVIEKLVQSKTPYAMGLPTRDIGARLNYISWKPYSGTFDWSGFDNTVSEKLIRTAFAVVKSFFKEGSVDEGEWRKIVNYFIFTPILMPDGRVYYGKRSGIPSGSYFTGIIGTIVNLILIEYLTLEQGLDIYSDNILVMGDDSIVGLHEKLDLKRMARVALSSFGMNLHQEKQRFNRNARVLEFLSHQWKGGRCFRPITTSVVKLVYSERSWDTRQNDAKEIRLARLFAAYKDNYKMWPIVRKVLIELGVDEAYPRFVPAFAMENYTSKKDKYGEFGAYNSLMTEQRVRMAI